MKPAPFSYRRAATLDEALAALAGSPGAKVLAGGQSLVPLLSMRLAAPELLVDVNRLPGLAAVTTGDDGVRVGALARQSGVLADRAATTAQPLLAQALRRVAHPTIRNRGTVVGSLVHADPAAELPVVLTLLGGTLEVVSTRGRRVVASAELFDGPLQTTLAADELAVEAFFPSLPADAGVAFDEVARRNGDYALCGVAALVRLDGATVTNARCGYLSVAEVPTVVDVTDALAGGVTDATLASAGELALGALDPQDDLHASADYRAQLVRVLTARVLRDAADHARERAEAA